MGISADGRWVAAAVEEGNEVVFVDTQSGTRAFSVRVRGKNPEHAVFSPDGRCVFVSAEEGGQRPWNLALTPDGRKLSD